jgi:pimeloyl-ACP methyl ester carboxylesterase
MSLHIESHGTGAPLLLIHGWGMHGDMWGQVTEQLAQTYTVHSVDLPGHGKSSRPTRADGEGLVAGGDAKFNLLDEIVAQLATHFPDKSLCAGRNCIPLKLKN